MSRHISAPDASASGAGDAAALPQPLTRRELRERERLSVSPLEIADEIAATVTATAGTTAAAPHRDLTPHLIDTLEESAGKVILEALAEPHLDSPVRVDSDRVIAAPAAADAPPSDYEQLPAAVPAATLAIPLPTRAQLRLQEQEANTRRSRRAATAAAAGTPLRGRPAGWIHATATLTTSVAPTLSVQRTSVPTSRVPKATSRATPSRSARGTATVRRALASATVPTRGSRTEPSGRTRSGGGVRRAATKGITVAAMAFAALMAVSTSVPAEALLSSADVQQAAMVARQSGSSQPAQSMEMAEGTDTITVQRDGYESKSIAEIAAASGIRLEATFINNPNGTIQWPFAVGVHVGDHFGYRNCAGCSVNHGGQDFNPGIGAPIQAIADGVVSVAEDGEGSLGVYMIIDHQIDGEPVSSVYAHMIHGTMLFEEGDVVKVGDVIGKTGNTGMSTGPHLHFEIRLGGKTGTKVDPYEWLLAHTN